MNIALIVASGKGTRISSSIPKQFIKINGKEMFLYTLLTFSEHQLIDKIIIVTLEEYVSKVKELAETNHLNKVVKVVIGGKTRQDSVRNGLNSIECNDDDIVLIHDCDRPLLTKDLITRLINETLEKGNACPVVDLDEHPQQVSNSGRIGTYNGASYSVQTPQCFKFNKIKLLHNRLKEYSFSDDASLFDYVGEKANLVRGEKENIKITLDCDLKYFIDKMSK